MDTGRNDRGAVGSLDVGVVGIIGIGALKVVFTTQGKRTAWQQGVRLRQKLT